MKIIGIGIILLGIALTAVTAITFFTKKKVIDIGSLELFQSNEHNLNWSPVVGIAIILVGALVLWYPERNK